jgi:hypothetical protein
VCFKLVNHEPVPVSAFEAKFSPQLDKIVSQAMAKDPAQRYQSGMAMAADIQALRESSGFIHAGGERVKTLPQPGPASLASWQPLPPAGRSSLENPFLIPGVMAVILAGFAIWGAHASSRETPLPFRTEAMMAPAPPALNKHGDIEANTLKGIANQPASTKHSDSSKPKKTSVAIASAPKPALVADAMLQIEVEHHFADASATVWLDNRLIYTKALHGDKQRRALLFKRVNGQQFDVIKVPSGVHQLRVRVHSNAESYDQSKMIAGASIQSASILHITCAQKGAGLELTLQKATNQ